MSSPRDPQPEVKISINNKQGLSEVIEALDNVIDAGRQRNDLSSLQNQLNLLREAKGDDVTEHTGKIRTELQNLFKNDDNAHAFYGKVYIALIKLTKHFPTNAKTENVKDIEGIEDSGICYEDPIFKTPLPEQVICSTHGAQYDPSTLLGWIVKEGKNTDPATGAEYKKRELNILKAALNTLNLLEHPGRGKRILETLLSSTVLSVLSGSFVGSALGFVIVGYGGLLLLSVAGVEAVAATNALISGSLVGGTLIGGFIGYRRATPRNIENIDPQQYRDYIPLVLCPSIRIEDEKGNEHDVEFDYQAIPADEKKLEPESEEGIELSNLRIQQSLGSGSPTSSRDRDDEQTPLLNPNSPPNASYPLFSSSGEKKDEARSPKSPSSAASPKKQG
ncbi:MAG: hypothetical protein ACD_60C00017G0006 [uncultured bacterium]|nr:MAG: hypothetical protein ACD_60C00017G0006 [uncultured bacterium]